MSAYSKCCWPKCRRQRGVDAGMVYCAIHAFYGVMSVETDCHLDVRISKLENRMTELLAPGERSLIYAERSSLLLLKALRWRAEITRRQSGRDRRQAALAEIEQRRTDLNRQQAELEREEALAILGGKKPKPVKLEPGERFLDL